MKATLITIGNEVLSGDTLDTNSHFIAKHLFEIGVSVTQKITIGDDEKSIKNSLKQSCKESDVIFITGGLGPTKDDITKKVICDFLNDKLVLHQPSRDHIYKLFKKLNREVNKTNEAQALVPSKSKVIINKLGTAPCLWVKKNDKILICLPGVPYEMEELIKKQIIPLIKKKFKLPFIISRQALSIGVPESILSEKLSRWEKNIPNNMQLAYLPSGSRVKVKLTQIGENKKKIESDLESELNKLYDLLGDSVFSVTEENPEDRLLKFLKINQKTLAIAENCTGGLLSYIFVSQNISSQYYLGGINAYSTKLKKNILKISDNFFHQHSSVSSVCVELMAKQIAFLMQSDLGISTTGFFEPNNYENKYENKNIIGQAFVGVFYNGKVHSNEIYLPNLSRREFMDQVTKKAIEFAVEICCKKEK